MSFLVGEGRLVLYQPTRGDGAGPFRAMASKRRPEFVTQSSRLYAHLPNAVPAPRPIQLLLFAEAASLIRLGRTRGGRPLERLQQQTTAAPPAAAAPANSTKVPAAAVPVSTVAHSNNLDMYSPCLKTTLDHISRTAPWR